MDLDNLGYQDDPWVLASCVAQVFYLPDPQTNLPPEKTKHVLASGKQHIIGVDGVDDVDEYNNYTEIQLFTDFPKKISVVEKNLSKNILPSEQKGVRAKIVMGQLVVQHGVFVCICETTFMYVCETIFMYVCDCRHENVCIMPSTRASQKDLLDGAGDPLDFNAGITDPAYFS